MICVQALWIVICISIAVRRAPKIGTEIFDKVFRQLASYMMALILICAHLSSTLCTATAERSASFADLAESQSQEHHKLDAKSDR